MSSPLRPHGQQHTKLSCPSLSPGVCSNSHPLSWRCHPTTSSSVSPFSSCPQSFAASGSFPMSRLFASGSQELQLQYQSPSSEYWALISLGLTELMSLLSKDSQESSLAPQFESISSSALSLLYDPTLTSVHDYWKTHSLDYMNLSCQSDVSAF